MCARIDGTALVLTGHDVQFLRDKVCDTLTAWNQARGVVPTVACSLSRLFHELSRMSELRDEIQVGECLPCWCNDGSLGACVRFLFNDAWPVSRQRQLWHCQVRFG